MKSPISIETIRYCVDALVLGSINAAADKNLVTQPAISISIKKFENLLGVKIVERSFQGVKPTAAGKELLPVLDNIISGVNGIYDVAEAIKSSEAGPIRIGISPAVDKVWAIDFKGYIRQIFNDRVQVFVEEAEYSDLIRLVQSCRLELLITPNHVLNASLASIIVDTDTFHTFSSSERDNIDYGESGCITLEEASRHPAILPATSCGLRKAIDQIFREESLSLTCAGVNVESCSTLHEWVLTGQGAVVLPSRKSRNINNGHPLRFGSGKLAQICFAASWNKESRFSEKFRSLDKFSAHRRIGSH